jgi:hypothetical protein
VVVAPGAAVVVVVAGAAVVVVSSAPSLLHAVATSDMTSRNEKTSFPLLRRVVDMTFLLSR